VSRPDDPGRRRFVLGVAAGAAAAAGLPSLRGLTLAAEDEPRSHLAALNAVDAIARMSRGELSCERYAAALLERCRLSHALNAFITLEPDRVREDARARDIERKAGKPLGPLFGLPIPVKDSVNTRDYPTTGGTPALKNFRPKEDAPLVASLRAAGAIVLGKTNLHELSYGWTSNNLAFGAVHNPYDPSRIPGGSSGGTAATIAARLAPLGIAEDTEGSIRVPAAFCGIVGFRPTTGRYSTQGCVPISRLFDQVGPHARSIADVRLFDSVLMPDARRYEPKPLRGVRLGIVRDYWYTGLDPEVERVTEAALSRLKEAGAVLLETPLPGVERLVDLTTDQVQNHDVRVALARYLEQYETGVTLEELIAQASPDIRATFKSDVMPGGANFVTEPVYAAARDRFLPELRQLYRKYFEETGVAAMVFPATRVPPPRIGEETTLDIRGQAVPFDQAVARNIAPGSTAGVPGLVLPAGLTGQGLPVALEFDGPAHGDRALIELGDALEQALGSIPPPALGT
jgi:Asp-tRNA(Asn)/Glu-tRNA(Gln) amidotransferase A subunit family amidase